MKKAALLALGLTLSATAALGGANLWSPPLWAKAGEAALYSPDGDALFAQPYVDIDEWRDFPVRHRYVHGGFGGTDTRFSFYFPPIEQYRGRFFQHLTPVPDSENLAQRLGAGRGNRIAAAIEGGAYFVETNGGGRFDIGAGSAALADPTITAYRANAASAAYSRVVAQRVYGTEARPFGYVYGGSGGAFRTIGSFENTTGVWDGAVPYVMGSNMAIPNMFTWRMRTLRVLGPKLDQVVDAASPGGSGDIYAGLTPLEREVLEEATRMGFYPESWFGWRTMGIHGFAALYQGVLMADQSYFSQFWTTPGYLGFDHPEQFDGARMQHDSTIAAVLTEADVDVARLAGTPQTQEPRGGVDNAFRAADGARAANVVGFRLADMPPAMTFLGGDLLVKTGAAVGQRLTLSEVRGDLILLGVADPRVAARLQPGDTVVVDNSNFLAMESYHRHQVPDAGYKVWDQFRKADGSPVYPQRPFLIGPAFVRGTGGAVLSGQWSGKMIVVESLWDREALPWQADWYRGLVQQNQGDATDANLRLWYTDHALHGDSSDPGPDEASRIVSYLPVLNQALRDLAEWVERGIQPSPSTGYSMKDGQVRPAAKATARLGIQPVVTLTANGGKRAQIRAGQSVRFAGTIAAPQGTGKIVWAGWDMAGTGQFATAKMPKGKQTAKVVLTHRFDTPGTYFIGLKGASQRNGDTVSPHARIENIDRVRVVVR